MMIDPGLASMIVLSKNALAPWLELMVLDMPVLAHVLHKNRQTTQELPRLPLLKFQVYICC